MTKFPIVKPCPENGEVALTVPLSGTASAIMAFSLRRSGCSTGPFDSLNFSVSQGDSPENVGRNFSILGERLAIDTSLVATCRQVHGDRILVMDAVPTGPTEADAIITARPGIFPAVKTADCLPILLIDPIRKVAAAVHAGRQGTVLGITRKVVGRLVEEFGTDASDVVAALGPAIGPCCYEVDEPVLEPFRESVPDAERFIHRREKAGATRDKVFHLDFVEANRVELVRAGVRPEHITSTNLCTACNPDLCFSYRRDGPISGRHIALVGFTE